MTLPLRRRLHESRYALTPPLYRAINDVADTMAEPRCCSFLLTVSIAIRLNGGMSITDALVARAIKRGLDANPE